MGKLKPRLHSTVFLVLSVLTLSLIASCDTVTGFLPVTESVAQGTTMVVDSTADVLANDGACTLREAIINSNNNNQSGSTDCPAGTGNDTILLKGFYRFAIEGFYESAGRTGDLDITDNLTIQGAQEGATVDGNFLDRVFDISNGAIVTFSRITIQNGNVYLEGPQGPGEHGAGGAIAVSGSTVFLQESTLTNNTSSSSGPGIWNDGGTLYITNTTISNNFSGDGQGAVSNRQGLAVLQNSTIADNTLEFEGGGIFNWEGGRVELLNSTVSGNEAYGNGAGIFNDAGTVIVKSSTITGNRAYDSEGGGINNASGTVNVQNSIIAGNSAHRNSDCAGQIILSGHNLIGDGTGCDITANGDDKSNLVGAANNLYDPLLGPLRNNGGFTLTHALLAGSPAIDHIPQGTNGCGTSLIQDQRGVARPQGSACDSGAFEAVNLPPGIPIDFRFTRTLAQGDSGEDVKYLQITLNWLGYQVAPDGQPGSLGNETTFFGSVTEQMVEAYNQGHTNTRRLTGNKVVGAVTNDYLNQALGNDPNPRTPIREIYSCMGESSSWLGSPVSRGPYALDYRHDFEKGYIAPGGSYGYRAYSIRGGVDTNLPPDIPKCVQGLSPQARRIADTYNRIGGELENLSRQPEYNLERLCTQSPTCT